MKKYICGFEANRIESNENFYAIYTEEELNNYKEFFNDKCKSIDKDEQFEVDPGYDDAEITLYWIRKDLEMAVEVTPDVEKALKLLSSILPSKDDILYNIKRYIEEEGYLED